MASISSLIANRLTNLSRFLFAATMETDPLPLRERTDPKPIHLITAAGAFCSVESALFDDVFRGAFFFVSGQGPQARRRVNVEYVST
jgi:hypothetical protein